MQDALTFNPATGHTFTAGPETQAGAITQTISEETDTGTLTKAEIQSMHKVLYNTVNRLR